MYRHGDTLSFMPMLAHEITLTENTITKLLEQVGCRNLDPSDKLISS